MQKIIQTKDLNFSYNTKKIISHLNASIFKGDFIGIFGENGSGKTTLIQLLLGILKPNSGEISWFDEEGNITSKNNFNVEYISQKAQMIDNIIPITVKELLQMGNKPKGSVFNHFLKECSYENIENALKHVHMLEYINHPFSKLSGGQKQRVLIAKSLISNPDIIIMDEPTAGVDLIAQKHFYELLDHLNKIHNITIIIISHETRFIEEKIKRLWYVGKNSCDECKNNKEHLLNIKMMFKNQEVEFI